MTAGQYEVDGIKRSWREMGGQLKNNCPARNQPWERMSMFYRKVER